MMTAAAQAVLDHLTASADEHGIVAIDLEALAKHFGVQRQTVSHHLRNLKDRDLIRTGDAKGTVQIQATPT